MQELLWQMFKLLLFSSYLELLWEVGGRWAVENQYILIINKMFAEQVSSSFDSEEKNPTESMHFPIIFLSQSHLKLMFTRLFLMTHVHISLTTHFRFVIKKMTACMFNWVPTDNKQLEKIEKVFLFSVQHVFVSKGVFERRIDMIFQSNKKCIFPIFGWNWF